MNPRYAPDRETLPNGVIVETYGRAHTARQADAQALLDEISWAESAISSTVWCRCQGKKKRRLGYIYRTSPAVIRLFPAHHVDADLRQVQRQLAPPPLERDTRVHYGADEFLDILDAPADRDLHTRCKNCGRHELDRDKLLADVARGLRDISA